MYNFRIWPGLYGQLFFFFLFKSLNSILVNVAANSKMLASLSSCSYTLLSNFFRFEFFWIFRMYINVPVIGCGWDHFIRTAEKDGKHQNVNAQTDCAAGSGSWNQILGWTLGRSGAGSCWRPEKASHSARGPAEPRTDTMESVRCRLWPVRYPTCFLLFPPKCHLALSNDYLLGHS